MLAWSSPPGKLPFVSSCITDQKSLSMTEFISVVSEAFAADSPDELALCSSQLSTRISINCAFAVGTSLLSKCSCSFIEAIFDFRDTRRSSFSFFNSILKSYLTLLAF